MSPAALNSPHQPKVEGSSPATIESIRRVNKLENFYIIYSNVKNFSAVAAGSSALRPYLIFQL